MKRFFEKISYEQFKKDIMDDETTYQEYEIPKRSTIHSAGYDFKTIYDVTIQPGETVMIPTGVRVSMYEDEVLYIIIRSSMGYKYQLNLANQMGVIDSDYYGSKNEGHIFIPIRNNGEKEYTIKASEHFAQGIFSKYLISEKEEPVYQERIGGFGSTSKGEDSNE